MPFLYSTPFDNKIHLKLDEIIKQYPKSVLVLDTNICVYFREFYNNPQEFINNYSTVIEDLVHLLGSIERYDLEVAIGLGLDESCRQLESFELHQMKKAQMRESLINLLNLDSISLFQLIYSNQEIESIKDITKKTTSKIDAFKHEDSIFSGLNLPTYACMLKIYLLNEELKNKKITRFQAFEEINRFMDEELDLVGASVAAFAFHYFGDNTLIKKMLNKKAKNKNDIIHNIWNASLDVCIPLIVANHYGEEDGIPILVTADKGLNNLLERINLDIIFTFNGSLAKVPQLTTFTAEGTKWTDIELGQIELLANKIRTKRTPKISKITKNEKLMSRVIEIVDNLEVEVLKLS